jgi:hypothetical protein
MNRSTWISGYKRPKVEVLLLEEHLNLRLTEIGRRGGLENYLQQIIDRRVREHGATRPEITIHEPDRRQLTHPITVAYYEMI